MGNNSSVKDLRGHSARVTHKEDARYEICCNFRVRRFLVAHRLQVVLGAGIEQLDQSIAMPFHGFRFPDAGRDPGHTDLHHRLIIFVLEVVWLANDHLDFAQLERRDAGS